MKEYLEARARIQSHLRQTPLLPCPFLKQHLASPYEVYLKCEHEQITNSFKLRGALNALIANQGILREKGVVARSSGNFAQAMAWGAKRLGIHVTLVMPVDAPQVKIEKTEALGANVLLCGTTHQEGNEKVQELVDAYGLYCIPPFDHEDVIAGQGTLALEILEQRPSIQHCFGPIGGGGLMAGCSTVFKSHDPCIEVLGVEPEHAGDFALSRSLGKRTAIEKPRSIADGLKAPVVGEKTWPILQKNIDRPILVSDRAIKAAMKLLYDNMGLVIEPSGAASVAALLDPGEWMPNGDVVCILSGGNVDHSKFKEWMRSPSALAFQKA